VHDLAIVLVAHHSDRWLRSCLESVLRHTGECSIDVVVVNNADDDAEEIVARGFPSVRLIRCENHGFAHANNRGIVTCDARYILLLNVDTEVVSGTFAELVEALDARQAVGVAGVRQVGPDGTVHPSVRRFPSAVRALCEAVGFERLPFHPTWSGERELQLSLYEDELACDWTSGSFLALRREALQGIGLMDERYFLYSEEPDLCLRAKRAGWEVRHLPVMTIIHHAGKAGVDARLSAQDAYSRIQFARKFFSVPHRHAYAAALAVGYGLRAAAPGTSRTAGRRAARSALRTLVGLDGPPFGPPPQRSFALERESEG
jgi:GT2 family glycosyltransferase